MDGTVVAGVLVVPAAGMVRARSQELTGW